MNKSTPHASPLPVCILSGFLGAGKTTLLNRLLRTSSGLRIGVVVNDFGSIDIDSSLVESVAEDTISLTNGCICCTMRGDFLEAVVKLVRRPEPVDLLLVETSGVSDPTSIVQTLANPKLSQTLRVDSIATVVDAAEFLSLSEAERDLAVAQVTTADIVIINKTDLVDEPHVVAVEQRIVEIAQHVRVLRTQHGEVPLPLLFGSDEHEPRRRAALASDPSAWTFQKIDAGPLHGPACSCHDCTHGHGTKSLTDAFESVSLVVEPPMDLDKLREALIALPMSVFRLKGFFYVDANPDRQFLIQVVGARISAAEVKPWGQEPPRSKIVAIGRKGRLSEEGLSQVFSQCMATPRARPNGLAEKLMFWRRAG